MKVIKDLFIVFPTTLLILPWFIMMFVGGFLYIIARIAFHRAKEFNNWMGE